MHGLPLRGPIGMILGDSHASSLGRLLRAQSGNPLTSNLGICLSITLTNSSPNVEFIADKLNIL